MQKSLKQDTLSYQLGVRPLVQQVNNRNIPLASVVKSLNHLMSKDNMQEALGVPAVLSTEPRIVNPEEDALTFYMMNHAISIIRKRVGDYEPLGDYLPIVETYHQQLAVKSVRMFFYLLMICTRESRHDKSDYGDSMWKDITKKYGNSIQYFHSQIKGNGSDQAVYKLRNSPPAGVPLGHYCDYLSTIFHKGKYSGGFGGKAWAAIADCLKAFVDGVYSAEMMMDTAFTLCHNNGPIFNKGMLFHMYGSDIIRILDVQRSGQIPQLVLEGKVDGSNQARVVKLYGDCASVIGDEFKGHVDWFQVELLGAVQNYMNEQKKQVALHGYPKNLKALQEAAKAAEKVAMDKKAKEENEKALAKKSEYFEYMPNLYVKKVTRDF